MVTPHFTIIPLHNKHFEICFISWISTSFGNLVLSLSFNDVQTRIREEVSFPLFAPPTNYFTPRAKMW